MSATTLILLVHACTARQTMNVGKSQVSGKKTVGGVRF